MSGPQKLRIGLLQDSVYANPYIRDLIVWAGQQDDLEISHVIVHAVPHQAGGSAFKAIQAIEQRLLRVYDGGRFRDHLSQSRVDDLIPNVLSTPDPAQIQAAGCDLLLHAGSGALQGEILDVAPLGVISLDYGDNRVIQGGPPGFWESYLEWPATGFVIQRLRPDAAEGDVLLRGSYPTKWFFLLNQAALFSKAGVHLKDLLKRLARDRSLPPAEAQVTSRPRLFGAPSAGACLGYLARLKARFIRRTTASLFHYRHRWAVSFAPGDWRHADLARAKTPALPRGRFLADPFLWKHQGKTWCLVEDYGFSKGIGWISAMEIDGQNSTSPEEVLVEPFHLSFPFLFEFNGAIYLCPECSASNQIRLYRSTEFPRKWEFVKAIMSGVSAADTMLFERDGRWWMLTNLDRTGQGDFGAELYLFSAESPLSDSWVPHPRNPLKIDPIGGRNAGLLRDGEKLFRAGQVQGFDRYGAGTRLFEIISLSASEYEERLVSEIRPTFRKRLLGTHHISSTDGVTVVDSVRREFVW
jgi:hypothetical protein